MLGVFQSKKVNQISADIQALMEKGLYKGLIHDVPLGDINLKEGPNSYYLFKGFKGFARLDTYSAKVENSNAPKTVKVYYTHHKSKKVDVMKASSSNSILTLIY
ncbi:hypothetical protein F5146DRAFT_999311 [Armillaria mellea]|nr:hypothetical protein F5146DRAFT_999311 [Armillaria mellea]